MHQEINIDPEGLCPLFANLDDHAFHPYEIGLVKNDHRHQNLSFR